ncbi:hypothetical protein ACVBEF_00765 [Glaciimonas sp. GG7]
MKTFFVRMNAVNAKAEHYNEYEKEISGFSIGISSIFEAFIQGYRYHQNLVNQHSEGAPNR